MKEMLTYQGLGEVVLADTGDNLNPMATRTACLWQVICLL